MTKILIIEDEAFIRENLEDILSLEGFETVTAADGMAGIAMAQRDLPDLIICDIMMPYGDGYSVIQALRNGPQTKAIPFIFLTAKADRASLRQGMTLGADDYLTKPFTPQEVIGSVRTRLERQLAQQAAFQTRLQDLSAQLSDQRIMDAVTRLPNRLALTQAFHRLLAEDSGASLAVLYLTLNQMGSIRATLGPDLNPTLIRQIGQHLMALEAVGGMAYLSDHQFALVMRLGEGRDLEGQVEAVAGTFATPMQISSHEIFLAPRWGVAVYPQDGDDLDTLLLAAELAASLSEFSPNAITFYSDDLQQDAKHRFTIEADLYHALDQQQLQVYYQPQFAIQTEQLVGAEALMRWLHPVRGYISPAHFIPIAEASRLIIPMGEWVLRAACQQVQQWPQYPAGGHISVNLSTRQFTEPNLIDTVIHILAETGLSPQRLELEITESILMQDAHLAEQTLAHLAELGVRIAIDDFGVGYSSFKYLQRFSLNTLKLDRCFVQSMATNAKNPKIVAAMIHMAHDLGLSVVAEGVERQEELDQLREFGCDIAQGYWYSQPIPPHQFEQQYFTSPVTPSAGPTPR
ncbi:GGDEF domain-containing response regulator [Leptolyngbya sp. BL0902]|uniref:putative bifunctional diguanylate cyclase/phosphodiesterase n=1 Tax=Leptolyngbya sp. BL0902 TaxID=1115757 RepID=UPI0018E86D5D|nr:EAL domain-containing protein [Leptolyngbya sp. BL0902]QQE64229.1 GGDEF domain-containing response regulator [Leptolyngbya sp. BL0902]